MNTKISLALVAVAAIASAPRSAHACFHNESHDSTNDYLSILIHPPGDPPGVEPFGVAFPAGDFGGASSMCGNLDVGHFDSTDYTIDIDNYSFTMTSGHEVQIQLSMDVTAYNTISQNGTGEIGVFIVNAGWPTTFTTWQGGWMSQANGRQNLLLKNFFLPAGNYLISVEAYDNQEDITTSAPYTLIIDASVSAPVGGAVEQLSSGGLTSCGINKQGALYCWGYNNDGQIGDGTTTTRTSPTEIFPGGVTDVAVSSSGNNVCAVVAGTLYCWGDDTYGQIGNGVTGGSYSSPVQVYGTTAHGLANISGLSVGDDHVCVSTGAPGASGVECWGSNQYGQLGLGSTTNYNTPQSVTLPTHGGSTTYNVAAIASGDYHSCMLMYTGTVADGGTNFTDLYCWGYNGDGEIGQGTTTYDYTSPQRVFAPLPGNVDHSTSNLTAEGRDTCAINNGTQYCFGSNTYGQIGDGTTTGRTSPTAVGAYGSPAVAMGDQACTFSSSAGANYTCWGLNAYGELGLDDNTDYDKLSPTFGYFPSMNSTSHWTGLTGGTASTCGILIDTAGVTAPYCWGNNGLGELGTGNTTSTLYPTAVAGGTGTGGVWAQ